MAGRMPRGDAPPARQNRQTGPSHEERDPAAAARDCAYRLLGRRDHSAAELRRKLLQRGFQDEIVQALLDRLTESGFLNDRRFAERWVEAALTSGRSFGPRLRMELQRRGIASELAAEVSARATTEIDEHAALRELVARKMPTFDPLTASDRERRRIFGYLQRRGFSTAAIISLLRAGTETG